MPNIVLPERLTIAEASVTLAQLTEQVQGASALQYMDSSAVAVLLACQRQAKALGRPLRVVGAPAKLMQLAQLYGVELLIGAA